MTHRCAIFLICSVALAATHSVAADETARLATLGRLWAYVKYSHPQAALGHVDWDAAVLNAIPAAQAAVDDAAFAAVLGRMLNELNDGTTKVQAFAPPLPTEVEKRGFLSRSGGVLWLRFASVGSAEEARGQLGREASLSSAAEVVVDLRGVARALPSGLLEELLVSERLQLPALRSALVTPFERYQTLRAAQFVDPSPGTRQRRAVFVVDRQSNIPLVLYSLRAAATAHVICVGQPPDGAEPKEVFSLPGGYVAQVRLEDLTIFGKRVVFGCDQQLPFGAQQRQLDGAANQLLSRPFSPPTSGADPVPTLGSEIRYAAPRYPDEPHRVLAVYRLWASVNYLFAYKHLMDRPWEEALSEFIPRSLSASTELEYVKVMAAMATRLQDSHVIVQDSPVFRNWIGGEPQAAQVRFVEGKPVVTRILESVPNGPELGDEVLAIDTLSIESRITRIIPYISFSNLWARNRLLGALIMGGNGARARSCVSCGGVG